MKANDIIQRGLAPVFLLLCLLLGGSSSGGAFANALLQLAGLVVILVVIGRGDVLALPKAAQTLLWIVVACAAYLLLTLIPIPANAWAALPHRDWVSHGFQLIGAPLPWLGVSLNPDGSLRTLLAFIPPLAMFLSTLAASAQGRRDAVIVLAGVAIISVLLGVAQIATGFQSRFYLYTITSRGGAVGFFANRNHLATLCLMTLPFMAALAAASSRGSPKAARVGQRVIAWGVLGFLTLGAGVVQSLAGWLLLPPTLLGCLLVYQHGRHARLVSRAAPVAAVVAVAAILVALFAPLSPSDLNYTFGEARPDQRRVIMATTIVAGSDYFPVGSGFGSFRRLYPQYENPRESTSTFVNHAHDDYLELFLEGGVVGLALLAAFLVWFVVQARDLWYLGTPGRRPLGRAATVSLCVLLGHSFVDYPFRTAAIAAVAAFACGLVAAAEELEPRQSRRRGRTRDSARAGASSFRVIDLGLNQQ